MFDLINKHNLSPIILFVVSVSHIDIGFIEVDTLILRTGCCLLCVWFRYFQHYGDKMYPKG